MIDRWGAARRARATRNASTSATDSSCMRPRPTPSSTPPPRHRPALTPVQRVVSGGLVTLIATNTLAPLWAPVVIPQPDALARDVVEHLLQRGATTRPPQHNAVAVRAAALSAKLSPQVRDASAIFADVDARLQGIDHAVGAPDGTTRAAVFEQALIGAGVEPALAAAVAHGSARAEQTRRGVDVIHAAVQRGHLDPAVLLLGGASLLDRLSSDTRLEAVFVVGFALAPHLNSTARSMAEAAVHVGEGALAAAQRHQAAIEHLKRPGTGNPVVDGVGFVAGTAVDIVASGLAFFGPGPALGLLRGVEPALVLAQFIAAKTAVAGTQKTLATWTSMPEDAAALAAGFLAGAAAHAGVDGAADEARATVAHVRGSAHALAGAVGSGELRAIHAALHEAVATATPAEQALWAHVLRSVVEQAVVGG